MHTTIWELYGDAIQSHHAETLAAYLGHEPSLKALEVQGVAIPTRDDFGADSAFDPNPHKLKFSQEFCDMTLFVHSLAVWGPDVLLRTAFACAELQMESQSTIRADLRPIRDAAFHAVKNIIDSPTDAHRNEVVRAAIACHTLFDSYEEEPNGPDKQMVWSHLGAPWFAVTTAGKDFSLQEYDGPGPREASSTWCRRNSVWPQTAAHAAAEWTSYQEVYAAICSSLLKWILGMES